MSDRKHGAEAYKKHRCRCKICKAAKEKDLQRRRDRRKTEGTPEGRRLPSVTNSLVHDTMTREEFMRLRGYETQSTK